MKLHGTEEIRKKRKRSTAKTKEIKRVCKNNYTKEFEKVNILRLNSKNITK